MNYKEIAWNCLKKRLIEISENNPEANIKVYRLLDYVNTCEAVFAVNILDEVKKLEKEK